MLISTENTPADREPPLETIGSKICPKRYSKRTMVSRRHSVGNARGFSERGQEPSGILVDVTGAASGLGRPSAPLLRKLVITAGGNSRFKVRRDVQGVLTSGLCVLCGLKRETSSARREIQLLQPNGWYKGPHKGPSTPPALSFGNDERVGSRPFTDTSNFSEALPAIVDLKSAHIIANKPLTRKTRDMYVRGSTLVAQGQTRYPEPGFNCQLAGYGTSCLLNDEMWAGMEWFKLEATETFSEWLEKKRGVRVIYVKEFGAYGGGIAKYVNEEHKSFMVQSGGRKPFCAVPANVEKYRKKSPCIMLLLIRRGNEPLECGILSFFSQEYSARYCGGTQVALCTCERTRRHDNLPVAGRGVHSSLAIATVQRSPTLQSARMLQTLGEKLQVMTDGLYLKYSIRVPQLGKINCYPRVETSSRNGTAVAERRNRAGRCRWSADFLGDLPIPPPFHSGAAPYSAQSPSSTLKTSLTAVYVSSLTAAAHTGQQTWRNTIRQSASDSPARSPAYRQRAIANQVRKPVWNLPRKIGHVQLPNLERNLAVLGGICNYRCHTSPYTGRYGGPCTSFYGIWYRVITPLQAHTTHTTVVALAVPSKHNLLAKCRQIVGRYRHCRQLSFICKNKAISQRHDVSRVLAVTIKTKARRPHVAQSVGTPPECGVRGSQFESQVGCVVDKDGERAAGGGGGITCILVLCAALREAEGQSQKDTAAAAMESRYEERANAKGDIGTPIKCRIATMPDCQAALTCADTQALRGDNQTSQARYRDNIQSSQARYRDNIQSSQARHRGDIQPSQARHRGDIQPSWAQHHGDIQPSQALYCSDTQPSQALYCSDIQPSLARHHGDVQSPQAWHRGDIQPS
ncbi:hypothetical protein PR048_009279 [Dryococelus australis]|uniref:Uncharacterized protein n=1 Tax=Dryococelus australis TaxID=614101 RepID=A0ABQ9I064_9NEOP|nr:hypothetical protein PR048_009279 [Dryococelus australis]